MNKKIKHGLIAVASFIPISFIAGYLYFIELPKHHAEEVANEFEHAIRNNDQAAFKQIIDEDSPYWQGWRGEDIGSWKKEFEKFHAGIEVYACGYSPSFLNKMGQDIIWAEGKMRARIDGKDRKYFEFDLVWKDGQWKIMQFMFPDYINY